MRHRVLELEVRKWRCLDCGRSFWQRFPGILPRQRASEPFRRSVYLKHWTGSTAAAWAGGRASAAPRWSAGFRISCAG